MSKSRSGAPRRVAAGLLAGALTVVGFALAPQAGAVDDTTTDRVAGPNRYSTAGAVAGQTEFASATTAILATGETFPDALAASGLAGANGPAPIILTQSNEYTDEAKDALAGLASLDDVLIVGGTAAISEDVADAVAADGYTVTRIAGQDRYETAAAIAGAIPTLGQIDGLDTALISTGQNFADALAGGPVAYAADLPILLVTPTDIPAATEAAITDLGIEQAVVLGGTAAVGEGVRDELASLTGNPVVVVAGQDRFETSTLIATFAQDELAWAPEEVLLANGLNFPDALSGGPLGGERQAPILLLASVPQVVLDWLDLNSDVIRRLTALGGTAAVSAEDLTTAETEGAEATENDAATGGDTQTASLQGPELQSASVSGIDIDELAISYTFTFDGELDEDTDNPAMFKLYNTDSRNPATGDVFADGDEMEIDGETAIIVFNLADYGVANATLAAVEEGAVEDENGNVNPPQSVGTSGISNSSSASLLSAEVVDEDDGIVEFEFASPVVPGTETGNYYEVITKEGYSFSGTELDATEPVFNEADADTHPEDDELSTTVRVQFECDGANTPAQYGDAATDADADTTNDPCSDATADGDPADFSDENIRRALVGDATLASARIQVVDVASGGTTDGPDLSSVTFASGDEDLEDNEVLFTFDEAVDTITGDAADFRIVNSHCNPTAGFVINDAVTALDAANADETNDPQDGQGFEDEIDLGGSCVVTPASVELADTDDFNDRGVVVTFDADYVLESDFLLAAQVAAGAVSEEDADDLSNNGDEVEFGSSQPASLWDDGEVSGPQLIGAAVEVDTSFGGDFDSWVLTLTFDKDIDDVGAVAGVQFWFDDGENVEVDDLTCETDDDTTVVCEVTDEDSDFANATVVSVEAGSVMTEDVFTLDDDETDVQFTSPEASIEVEVPEAPESDA